MQRPRILIGKPGLDGHDRGAKVIAAALRDAGMEVIYSGLRATPEMIVATALQESVDVIGLSILSGAHEPICRRVLDLMRARGLDVPLVVGGVVPPADVVRLRQMGVAEVFGQEATLEEVVARIAALAGGSGAAALDIVSTIAGVGVVGAGFMGTGIAEVTARAGFPTVLVKATPGAPDRARDCIATSLGRAVDKGKLTPQARDEALGRLTVTADRAAIAASDLVIESVVEDLPTKAKLFAELGRLAARPAILASNTSTLRITELARASGRADRTIGLHFFSPVPAMQLVELAHTGTTAPAAIEAATAFVARLGKTAVPVLDSTGFVVNRLLVPYLVGAIAAYEQGLARPEQIDTAMRLGCGHPMGPLALADLIGLDIVYAMAKLLSSDFRDARYRPPALLRRLVQLGQHGRKTRLGFYDYGAGEPRANEELWQLVRGGAFRHAIEDHAA